MSDDQRRTEAKDKASGEARDKLVDYATFTPPPVPEPPAPTPPQQGPPADAAASLPPIGLSEATVLITATGAMLRMAHHSFQMYLATRLARDAIKEGAIEVTVEQGRTIIRARDAATAEKVETDLREHGAKRTNRLARGWRRWLWRKRELR